MTGFAPIERPRETSAHDHGHRVSVGRVPASQGESTVASLRQEKLSPFGGRMECREFNSVGEHYKQNFTGDKGLVWEGLSGQGDEEGSGEQKP